MRDIYRKYSVAKRYLLEDRPIEDCVFCRKNYLVDRAVTRPDGHFVIIDALAAYDYWYTKKVKHHLMIVPKRHISSLYNMNQKESQQYLEIAKFYDRKEYDIFVRSQHSEVKSITRLHIHCIKTEIKPQNLFIKYWT
jgi:hypothetical protein